MIEISERYLAFGQNIFVKEVAIPVGEVIEEVAKEYPCADDVDLRIVSRPTAFLSGLDALIGISVFLGGWAGTKFLDEIYDAKLGPKIKEYFRPYIERRGVDKKYSLAILARKRGVGGSVLICCIGSSIEEIESSERHIPAALTMTNELLDSSKGNSVYLYVIEGGKFNLEPEVFESHQMALEGLKRMYPAKLPKQIKPRS
ncbi:hypothetical protein [Ectopseudomonas alcaliphila]|uniref:Uncharacterized protein n=1 Tax=Ectopseudomonas alcaliphila TaxID=101564 RepID=A0A1G7GD38_9GAMM|nr:hypothetical protein [Pseudomonas alcaliphila]MDX5994154.1 hypothetical protein [Pseudomonas alcaliphila]SDE86057.1 hypothetical protein SAMN05216575_104208 [Pseudomonas alcaliphila]